MKNLIFLFALLFSTTLFAQSITSIYPRAAQEIYVFDPADVDVYVQATTDQTAYAVVFSVDPIGTTKILNGKNKNLWAGVSFPSSRGGYTLYELTAILNGIEPGIHTLRVDVYGKNFRDLTDSQEISFYIKY